MTTSGLLSLLALFFRHFDMLSGVLFPFLAVSKANKRHSVNLKQAEEKLETELLFLKDVNSRD